MSDGYVSLQEAREAARREVLAHMERMVGRRVKERGGDESEPTLAPNSAARGWGTSGDESEPTLAPNSAARGWGTSDHDEKCRSLDSAEKRGSARDDGSRGGEVERAKSVVIDVPFEAARTAEQVRTEQVRTIRQGEAYGDVSLVRCQRMMADGRMCGLPVHEGTDQCSRHYRWYSLAPNYYGLPYPENATAVQEILARVAALVLRKQIEPRIGDTVARLCREMSRNLGAYQRESDALRRESVRIEGPTGLQ